MGHPNLQLKGRIYSIYGDQVTFSEMLRVPESLVSRVIWGRRSLPEPEKRRWAAALRCDVNEIFPQEKIPKCENLSKL